MKTPPNTKPAAAAKKKDVEVVEKKDDSTYYFFKELDSSEAKNITKWLIESVQKPVKERPKRLLMVINSPGGCLHSALGIVDLIQVSAIPVQAMVTGCAASAASLIFSACHSRVMTRRSYLMTHQYSSGNWGKYHEIKSARIHEDDIEKVMVDTYVQTTKLPESVVRATLLPETDVYLSATKSKELGLCDLII